MGLVDSKLLNALGLVEEAGEVAGIVKKTIGHEHPFERPKMVEELGDTAYYLAMTGHNYNITLSEILEANVIKINERYPDGFSSEASINRKA